MVHMVHMGALVFGTPSVLQCLPVMISSGLEVLILSSCEV